VLTLLFAAGEPSKVPVYIAGAVLVIWAIGLAAVGLTRPSFPYSQRGQRGVMLVTATLAAITVAMSIATSAFPK
jgi:MFS superfamily sulfate permease-like transporter